MRTAVDSQPAFHPALDENEKQHWSEVVRRFFDSNLLRSNFNGSILVAKEGTIVYERYQGFADLRRKDSLSAETPLQIASTSKTFTSAAVLKLIQEGRMGLNDSLEKFFPGFPFGGITVKMLLNHRSGLPEYLYFMDKGGWDRRKFASNSDVLNALTTMKPGRASRPDSRFNYCNTNFVLLALIVEKVSGQRFPDYMKRNFFEPLGMENTFVFTPIDTATTVTESYNWDGSQWQMDFSDGPYGDKNIYSTPRDLLKWDQAIYAGMVLHDALLDSAFTPYSHEKPGVHNYGLGWRLLVFPNGKKAIYHNGRWHGFNSAFARLPEEQATIIILTNRYNRNVYTTARRLYSRFGDYGNKDQGEE